MARTERKIFIFALFASDVIALSAASALAYGLRFLLNLDIFEAVGSHSEFYIPLTLALIPVYLIILAYLQLYNYHYLLGGTEEYARVLNGCSIGAMMLVGVTFFGQIMIARGWLILFWILSAMLVGSFRFLIRRIAYAFRRRGYLRSKTLIVGADAEGIAIARQLSETVSCGADLVGFLDDHHPAGDIGEAIPVLGSIAQLHHFVLTHGVEQVILSTTAMDRSQVIEVYEKFGALGQVELRLSSGLFEIVTAGARVREWGFVPLVSINKLRLSQLEVWMKTILELTLIVLALPLILPICAVIAIAIKLDSPGPVIYRRRVLGLGQVEFDALKFRSMYTNSDELVRNDPALCAELETNEKLKNDPRVTRVGKILRKYSLDELPQFYNIVRGQMGLVGPRMITRAEVEKYGKWKINLMTVKPGLTGLWQVSGRSDVSYRERVRLDMHYIRNYTIWLDLFIIFRTIPVVLGGRGAY